MAPATEEPYDITDAKLRVGCKLAPYMYSAVTSLIPVETPGLGTMGVDKYGRLYYDPAVFAQWSLDEAAAVVLHEAMHVFFDHAPRCETMLGDKPSSEQLWRWNVAADCAINSILQRLGTVLPKGGTTPDQYRFPHDLSAEEYYDLLSQLHGQGGEQGAGQPNTGHTGHRGGSCSDGHKRAWEQEHPANTAPGLDRIARKAVQRSVSADIQRYQGRGLLPGQLLRYARSILSAEADSLAQWYSTLAHAASYKPGCGDYTWRKLSRRQPPGGLRLPCPVRPMPNVTLVIDTSGSMGEDDLAAALGATQRALRRVEKLVVIAGDTDVKTCKKVFSVGQVDLGEGGGGTDMSALCTKAAEQRSDLVVCLTDGDTGWPDNPIGPRLIVGLTRATSCPTPEWATVVKLYRE